MSGTTATGRYARFTEAARPYVEEKYRHPVVKGIFDGTLDPRAFRHWIEQDYLYLLDYARSFAALAAQAPDDHVTTLVDGAHYTLHGELELHRTVAAEFEADLDQVVMGPACRAYTAFLLETVDDYDLGVIAMLPCMMGFAALGIRVEVPEEPRYRRWVETYASTDFQGFTARYAAIVDAITPDDGEADRVFAEGMAHELAFWDDVAGVIGGGVGR